MAIHNTRKSLPTTTSSSQTAAAIALFEQVTPQSNLIHLPTGNIASPFSINLASLLPLNSASAPLPLVTSSLPPLGICTKKTNLFPGKPPSSAKVELHGFDSSSSEIRDSTKPSIFRSTVFHPASTSTPNQSPLTKQVSPSSSPHNLTPHLPTAF